jgi:hypothetical protein
VTPLTFLRAAAPALIAELVMFLFVRDLQTSSQTALLSLTLVSWVALPALAGFRVSRAGGTRLLASVGGCAVSGVTLVCAVVSELLITRDVPALGGLVFPALVIALPIQALSGFVAGWAATRRASRGA